MTVIYLTLTVIGIVLIALLALFPLFLVLFAGEFVLGLIQFGLGARFLLFFIALDPRKLLTVMESLMDDFTPGQEKQRREGRLAQVESFKANVADMERNKRGVIMGRKQLESINKRVGERFRVTGINYTG